MPKRKSPKKRVSKTTTEPRAAIYIRVSTQYQTDRASLPVQCEELINYAKYALSINSYEIFEDAGFSAKNTDRPAYQQMIARVRNGEFTHVLVWKIDRISRNLLDFTAMYQELKNLGVTFISKNEQFDTSTAIGEAMLRIILVFAELERKMTSERVSAVMVSRASKGDWNGGKIPYGYDYDKDTGEFSINEDEAKVINLIYDLYESEKSLTVVAKYLNDHGYRARSGKPWNPTTTRKMLVSPFYAGVYRYNYRCEADGGSHTPSYVRDEDEWVVIEDHHPAIVDKARQKRIEVILQANQRSQSNGTTSYNRKDVHIFAGLLRCGICGSGMTASTDRERDGGWAPSKYGCTRRRRFNDCNNKFVSDITIGPFAMNYIANIIRAGNSFGKSTSIETLQKKLLRGDTFKDVVGIERPGLEELYNHLQSGAGGLEYKSAALTAAEASSITDERDVLLSEKRRLERALARLKSLYLYSEEGMSETDYVISRNDLMASLDSVTERLDVVENSITEHLTLSDEEFMAKASYFLVAQKLNEKRYIDYEKFIKKIDSRILKDFINSVVQNFCIKNGRVVSILFKNGIEHRFLYSDAEQ